MKSHLPNTRHLFVSLKSRSQKSISSNLLRVGPSVAIVLSIVILVSDSLAGLFVSGPGTFDATFGPHGYVTSALGDNSFDSGTALAIQADGKIVVAGEKSPYSSYASATVIRFNSDGTIDGSFGVRGVALLDLGINTSFSDVAIQPDGKIVAVGSIPNGVSSVSGGDMLVVRLNKDGSPDSSFNVTGRVCADFNSPGDDALTVDLQNDGKIVVGGFTTPGGNWKDYAFARFDANGSLDLSFGNGGKVQYTGNVFSGDDWVFKTLLQPDGKIVGIGTTSGSGSSNDVAGLIRINANGTLDPSFGNGGLVKTSFGPSVMARSGLLLPDGRIFITGRSEGSPSGIAAARYNVDGSLDPSFDGDGKVITQVGFDGAGLDCALQPDGKTIVAGYGQPGNYAFTLIRYNLDGSLDTSFCGTGISRTFLGGIDDKALAMGLLSDGRIIAAGYSLQTLSDRDVAVARFNPDGTLDRSFGPPGLILTSITNSSDTAFDVKTQPDGKILVAGTSKPSLSGENMTVVRYLPDGLLDPSFNGGSVTVSIGSSIKGIARVAIRQDGKIILAGFGQVSGQLRIVLARLTANGALDSSFGTGGRVVLGSGSIADGYSLENIALQNDGKVILGCLGSVSNLSKFIAIRLKADGSVDGSFGAAGKVIVSLSSGDDRLHSLAIQQNGQIVLGGGVSQNSGPSQFGIARLNVDGSLDKSFGTNGMEILDLGTLNTEAKTVAVQNDGKLLVGGGLFENFVCVRLNFNGSPDSTFGNDGVASVTVAKGSIVKLSDLAIQKNGKIVLGGFTNNALKYDFAATRLNSDGTVDLGFANNGVFNPDFGDMDEAINGVSLQRDGKILLTGGLSQYSRRVFSLIRLSGDATTTRADFDGDGKTDLSAFRPSDGNWYVFQSGGGGAIVRNWGVTGDVLTPGDYDGDGKADTAAFRPSTGQWLIFRSSDSTVNILNFGIAGDRPVAGDYDGDGKTDIAQFRPSQGVWYVFRSSDNGVSITTWGEATDLTVPADYDGDGKTDVAVFRPSTGVWYVFRSTAGPMVVGWGVVGDKPVEADYDGDGKDDVAVYRPSEGNWYVFRSSDNTPLIVNWGNSTDVPSPGDYDGDGKDDFAVFRDGTWFAYESTAGPVVSSWGAAGDTSIPSRYIP